MNKKQKVFAAAVVLVLVIVFLLVYRQETQAPTAVPSTSVSGSSPASSLEESLPAGPVSVDVAAEDILKEVDQDTTAFHGEMEDTAILDAESQSLNDIDQLYDQNQF